MKNFENFSTMNADRLKEVNGGGFAYDIGRIFRFIALSGGGSPPSVAWAITDWEINKALNLASQS